MSVCPFCKEPYTEFIPHSFVDEGKIDLPRNACESELGFWNHGDE